MRVQISTRVLDAIAAGASALRATEEALRTLHARTQGRGGLICVTPDGQVALAYNTHDMAGAGVDANGSSVWPMAVSRFA
jgi:isoaspartyl peptidase/L-asparaginase-like protein (Ntn-hydrolase superfamily)